MVSPRFTRLPMLTVYGNRFAREALADAHPELFDGSARAQMRFQEIREGERVELDDLAFTPVRANHTPQRGFAHSYILERGGKTLLYALDTGGYDPDMLEPDPRPALRRRGHGGHVRPEPRAQRRPHEPREERPPSATCCSSRGCIGADTPFFLTHLCAALDAALRPLRADDGEGGLHRRLRRHGRGDLSARSARPTLQNNEIWRKFR